MSKEFQIGVDAARVEAYAGAIDDEKNKTDFRHFNPYLAIKCKITDELMKGKSARLAVSVNGGPMQVEVNGDAVDGRGAMSKQSLATVIDTYLPGRGAKMADLVWDRRAAVVFSKR